MGLDEAIHIETAEGVTDLHIQPLTVAKIFRYFILKNKYDLTLLGKQVRYTSHRPSMTIRTKLVKF